MPITELIEEKEGVEGGVLKIGAFFGEKDLRLVAAVDEHRVMATLHISRRDEEPGEGTEIILAFTDRKSIGLVIDMLRETQQILHSTPGNGTMH